jgi:predicted alpha/beta-fold hydrolase
VAAVCPPLDLAACAGALDRPGNRLYRRYFMKKLRLSYRRRQRLRPDLYAARLERGLVTIRDFDQVITAHYGGFRHADDYYAARAPAPSSPGSGGPPSSSPPWTIPSCPPTRWPAGRCHPPVRREILSTGGHVGFVAPTRAPGFFWAAERVLHELEAWI